MACWLSGVPAAVVTRDWENVLTPAVTYCRVLAPVSIADSTLALTVALCGTRLC